MSKLNSKRNTWCPNNTNRKSSEGNEYRSNNQLEILDGNERNFR